MLVLQLHIKHIILFTEAIGHSWLPPKAALKLGMILKLLTFGTVLIMLSNYVLIQL